jgi:hypothetical protein
MDPDPVGPKTYGSGSAKLLRSRYQYVYINKFLLVTNLIQITFTVS